jgi:aspartyl-tRNA(Asn)/glutamyl-tRNA(Gln) amidotransferase subunit A
MKLSVDPAELSLSEAAAAVRDGRLTAVALTEACLARIDAHGGTLNAFISVEREAALEAARRADAEVAAGNIRGPLHGVPLAHKDMYYRKGHISTCGSKIQRNYVPDITATVLARLEAAGALYLGGLNMSEFAAGPTGHNEHFGNCRNPWNTEHITGGSSSGSGAATAARLAYGAMGSDTGGSVRLPAAICGVVGLKPTAGRISRYGAMPRSWTNDTMGPLARTALDCALLTGVIAGEDPDDPTTAAVPVGDYAAAVGQGVEGLRIGIPNGYFADGVSDEVATVLAEAAKTLEASGAALIDVTVPDLKEVYRLGDIVSKSEAASYHGKWIRTRPQDYGHHTLTRTEAGFHIPATHYIDALRLRGRHTTNFIAAVLGDADVLLAPVIPMTTPTIAAMDFETAADVPEQVAKMTSFTRPVNYLGLPSLSVPAGFGPGGLPVSFQVIGRPFDEETLFAVGGAYQRATEWHEMAPKLKEKALRFSRT